MTRHGPLTSALGALLLITTIGACTSSDETQIERSEFVRALEVRPAYANAFFDGATTFSEEQTTCIDGVAGDLGPSDLGAADYAELPRRTQEAIAQINDDCVGPLLGNGIVQSQFEATGLDATAAQCVTGVLMRVFSTKGWAAVFLDRDDEGARLVNVGLQECGVEPNAVPLRDGRPIDG